MEIADFDNSGTIDIGELEELCKKLDENFDMTKVTEIFNAQDSNSSGELDSSQFGTALYECLKLMNNDEDN